MEAPGVDDLEDGENANGLVVFGSLKIDAVNITSWNRSTNEYAKNPGNRDLSENRVEKGSPRPFISVESDAVGTTDITNSELAFLGYEGGVNGGPVVGITYSGGPGSIIKNNDIHDLYFGFYSNGVGNITIVNNAIHNNGHYGLDPHTGTHDMLIRNNTVLYVDPSLNVTKVNKVYTAQVILDDPDEKCETGQHIRKIYSNQTNT